MITASLTVTSQGRDVNGLSVRGINCKNDVCLNSAISINSLVDTRSEVPTSVSSKIDQSTHLQLSIPPPLCGERDMYAFSIHADDEDAGPSRCDQAFLSRNAAETHVNADCNEELQLPIIDKHDPLHNNEYPVCYRTRATLNRIQNETPERLLFSK